ncbi:branched-chain amino acid ABC transporter permease [Streptomyces sp. enrichment culture]|uniref:branched-chain amino acid ABC transporter permease n=1 Tax=Streptomyces sp. enrichment culture TaxID=1795815 RepID=UPI003F558A88
MTATRTPPTAAAPATPADRPRADRPPHRLRPLALPVALLAVLALLPYSSLSIPFLLDGPVNSPGSLQLLALCLVFGALATGYDLMFGRTGLLSFGHALYIAGGAYGTQLAMSELGLTLLPAALLTLFLGTLTAVVLGAISLRTLALGGVGFAMVTLAFAQAGAIFTERNPGGITGGEEGLPLHTETIPEALQGVANTANLYWLALGYLALVTAIVWTATHRPAGRLWQAIRDNEPRVSVLGRNPFTHKLAAFTLASALAVLGGICHLLVTAGATPHTTTPEFTLTLLVMAVLGGSGTRYGPLVGGILFTYLDQRLAQLNLGIEPMLILGTLFILAVLFKTGRAGRTTMKKQAPRSAHQETKESATP